MLLRLKTIDFDYKLPDELIAQKPSAKRDNSRLLLLNRSTRKMEDHTFNEIPGFLNSNDVLVLNDTKVIPARLFGIKEGGGAKIEVFLHKKVEKDVWEVLARPAKRLKIGTIINFGKNLSAKTIGGTPDGKRALKFKYKGDFNKLLSKKGIIPLPPYVKESSKELVKRYQTVYAYKKGATAAPTAGLHFTPDLLKAIKKKGVQIEYITLHTGLGTFMPVKSEYIDDHKIHSEEYEVEKDTVDRIKAAKKEGKRIIAVGTTVVRLLETLSNSNKTKGETDLFIKPGYDFKFIDAIITNFHLPRSTLLMLVSAFAGKKLIKKAYSKAVKKKYRFFSFGDAMLII